MGKLFGTDGSEGVANKEPLQRSWAYKLGRAGAFGPCGCQHYIKPNILVAMDTRISCDMLESAIDFRYLLNRCYSNLRRGSYQHLQ